MTNQQKELTGKHYLIADLYSHGHEASIEHRRARRGTDVVVSGQNGPTLIRVLTRFAPANDFLFGDTPPVEETPFYAFIRVFPAAGGVPHHEVYIAPSDWVVAASTQRYDDYILNHPHVNRRQQYTILLDDLLPFRNNWAALRLAA